MVDDNPRSGRPLIPDKVERDIIKCVTASSEQRQWSCAKISAEISNAPSGKYVSPRSVYNVLKRHGFKSYKRTVKPGLTKKQRDARLAWCMLYKDWTLEDWKNVIFTDETSVQKGSVRGKRRVWRKESERFHGDVITRRWKGFSEFMWWSCFTYDEKGPFHI
jgi:hypothetical protein